MVARLPALRILDYSVISVVMSGIMAAICHLDEFCRERTILTVTYTDRMEQYFIANSIAEEKQLAVFLTDIGGPTYELLRNLVSPDAPKDKSLEIQERDRKLCTSHLPSAPRPQASLRVDIDTRRCSFQSCI